MAIWGWQWTVVGSSMWMRFSIQHCKIQNKIKIQWLDAMNHGKPLKNCHYLTCKATEQAWMIAQCYSAYLGSIFSTTLWTKSTQNTGTIFVNTLQVRKIKRFGASQSYSCLYRARACSLASYPALHYPGNTIALMSSCCPALRTMIQHRSSIDT